MKIKRKGVKKKLNDFFCIQKEEREHALLL